MKRILGAAILFLLATLANAQGDYAQVAKIKRSFSEVKENLVSAIKNRGLIINTTSHVGNMLERTGQDVGSARRIYQDAEVVEFCSAKASRAVMEADPKAIALCPTAFRYTHLRGKRIPFM